ncbi:MAG: hypothetical protein QM487_05690, partial [Candidatus Marithrix sp.]
MKITDRRKNGSFSNNGFSYIHKNLFDVWGGKLKPKEVAVYLCIIANANFDECQISIDKIADQCGISKKIATGSVKVILDLGFIDIQQSSTGE